MIYRSLVVVVIVVAMVVVVVVVVLDAATTAPAAVAVKCLYELLQAFSLWQYIAN